VNISAIGRANGKREPVARRAPDGAVGSAPSVGGCVGSRGQTDYPGDQQQSRPAGDEFDFGFSFHYWFRFLINNFPTNKFSSSNPNKKANGGGLYGIALIEADTTRRLEIYVFAELFLEIAPTPKEK
jgi:hypothetical protein